MTDPEKIISKWYVGKVVQDQQIKRRVLVSPDTLREAIRIGWAMVASLSANTVQHTILETQVTFLQGLANHPNLDQLIDDSISPQTAKRIQHSVNVINHARSTARLNGQKVPRVWFEGQEEETVLAPHDIPLSQSYSANLPLARHAQ